MLDASIVVKWFRTQGEAAADAAFAVRKLVAEGELVSIAPALLRWELLNVAARKWRLERADIIALADTLLDLPIEERAVSLVAIAAWTARGLTAYDATYVALAERENVPLITEDREILAIAPGIAVSLLAWV